MCVAVVSVVLVCMTVNFELLAYRHCSLRGKSNSSIISGNSSDVRLAILLYLLTACGLLGKATSTTYAHIDKGPVYREEGWVLW